MARSNQRPLGAVVVFNNEGKMDFASDRFCTMVGYDRKSLVGKNLGDVLSSDSQSVYRDSLLPVLAVGSEIRDIYLPLMDTEGRLIPTMLSCTQRDYHVGLRNIGIFSRILSVRRTKTELFRVQQEVNILRLQNQLLQANLTFAYSALVTQTHASKKFKESLGSIAYYDLLTGLVNRRGFEIRFEAEAVAFAKSGIPFSLLMIDIDHFKQINDTNGHGRGDEVLKQVSALLKDTVRKLDFVARWGGDEFVALLPETGKDAAIMAGERIRRAIQVGALSTTVSIGAATYGAPNSTGSMIMANADRALYSAKNAGRNRVVHESDIEDSLDRRKESMR